MKTMLEVIKRAMELKGLTSQQEIQENPLALHYAEGQIVVLDYIIDESLVPEEMQDEVVTLYKEAIKNCKGINPNQEDSDHMSAKTIGAADILAWVLDISEEAHKINKERAETID